VGIGLLFWFLIIRPASRRQKDQLRMQSALSVGDEVVLTSGFYGTVRALYDDRIDVELSPDNITVTVARGAVGTIVARDSTAPSLEKTTDVDTSSTESEDS